MKYQNSEEAMTQQNAVEAIAVMIDTAKEMLKSAKQLSESNGLGYQFVSSLQDIYEEITEEWVDWNSSSC